HRHSFTVEVSQQLGLPRKVGVAALAEPTDGQVPVDAHAPHLVHANSASERFKPGDVVTPLIEYPPSHCHIFPKARRHLEPDTQRLLAGYKAACCASVLSLDALGADVIFARARVNNSLGAVALPRRGREAVEARVVGACHSSIGCSTPSWPAFLK